jgi:hypothetical protein
MRTSSKHRSSRIWIAAASLFAGAAAEAGACIGDCDENGAVTVNEIVAGVGLVLDSVPFDACPAFAGWGGRVDVADLTAAVRNGLEACSSYVERERLADARALWAAQGLTDYVMRFRRSCFCQPPGLVDIVVRGGLVASITDAGTGEPVAPQGPGLWGFPSVDALFDAIESALANADEAVIEYDAARGHPTSASFDFIRGAVDDELSLAILDLQPLAPADAPRRER